MRTRLLTTLTALALVAADWPGFRGPDGTGVSPEKDVPLRWSNDTNVKWKTALPEPGDGSPIVSAGKVFVTCAEDKGRKRSLYCFDRADGKQLWVRTVPFGKVMPTHETNNYAGSTPASDGERVVVWHSSAGLYCYDHDGNELWSRNLGEFRHIWGYGTSPVIHAGRVFMHCGPGEKVFMTALNLKTGKTLWSTDEPFQGDGSYNENKKYMGSWSTPVVVTQGDRTLIVCSMPTRVNAYDPQTGEIVWYCEGLRGPKGDLAYTSPIIAGDICVSMGGFGGPAIGFRMGGSGNITAENRLWRTETNPQRIGSGVFVDGHIYMANAAQSRIQCIETETGKVLWDERSGGGEFWGSLVYAGGRLYAADQRGTTIVFEPNPEGFEVIARNRLGEATNSTPAVSDGEIFIRTFQGLYCVGELSLIAPRSKRPCQGEFPAKSGPPLQGTF